MSNGGRLLSVGIAVSVIAFGASAAVAGRGAIAPLEPEQAHVVVHRYTHDRAIARCKHGTDVVSGGFAAPDRTKYGDPDTEILAASRKSADRFVVKADNFSFARGNLYAYAYCGHVGPVEVAEARSKRIRWVDEGGSATARCPDGLTAISGGWYGTARRGRPQLVPYVSRRVGTDGWKVATHPTALKGSAFLVAQAYCADVKPPHAEVKNVRSVEGLGFGPVGVNCDKGQKAIAGGFDAGPLVVWETGFFTSRRIQDGGRWRVAGFYGDDTRVYAYCA